MPQFTHAFAVPGEANLIDIIDPATGLSSIEHENLDQIRLRYPGAEIVVFTEWVAAKAARQDAPVTWSEVSQERYWEMLEVLPPALLEDRDFLVGEPWDHHALSGLPRFVGFRQQDGKYFESSRPMTIPEFKAGLGRPL